MMTRSLTSAVYSGTALTAREADRRAGRRRVRSDRAAGARHTTPSSRWRRRSPSRAPGRSAPSSSRRRPRAGASSAKAGRTDNAPSRAALPGAVRGGVRGHHSRDTLEHPRKMRIG
jgi:hypothetical protein